MAQYQTRLHIKVKKAANWKMLHDLDVSRYGFNCTAQKLFYSDKTHLTITDWSCPEKKLKTLVREISKKLGIFGVVIADSTDINAKPYTYGLYYLGSKLHEVYFEEPDEKCDMCKKVNISDMVQWLTYGQCEISTSEQQNLESFKINFDTAIRN